MYIDLFEKTAFWEGRESAVERRERRRERVCELLFATPRAWPTGLQEASQLEAGKEGRGPPYLGIVTW